MITEKLFFKHLKTDYVHSTLSLFFWLFNIINYFNIFCQVFKNLSRIIIAFPNLMRYTKILTPESRILTPQNLRLCTSQLW
ncbi:unknown protein [Microcystis aeruginosa NIES-843]|uniref:Uncharacterized protein n=1 Tax=Microcystis aeruginosa (strain NIES-843 / IAM M-2473) TaxID=449447 RepID=B0JLH7_MICAN|nr:unknown protein [Microcystis aeruginosa NIES-843]